MPRARRLAEGRGRGGGGIVAYEADGEEGPFAVGLLPVGGAGPDPDVRRAGPGLGSGRLALDAGGQAAQATGRLGGEAPRWTCVAA